MNLQPNPSGLPCPGSHRLLPLVAAVLLCCGASLGAQPAGKSDGKPAGMPVTAAPPPAATAVATAATAATAAPAATAATAASAVTVATTSTGAPAAVLAALAAPLAAGEAAAGNYRLSFKQLGRSQPFSLRGTDGRYNIPFSVRADEVITKASLKLRFAYSPDLLSELSKINVLINGEVAASLELPKTASSGPVTQVVDLPAHLITEYNQLTLQLIGHYSNGCEDPQHSSLWATISHHSELQLVTDAAAQTSDLALLPEPFFDARDGRKLSLPVVFAGAPDNATLEAAGTLASWFGLRAKGRVLNFPASVDTLPAKGHAIVLVGAKGGPAGLTLAAVNGPTLTIVANPNDPNGKLLLVQGRDGAELKAAAATLAIASKTLAGASQLITQPPALSPRRAYDAPNWLRADRPVKLSELGNPQALNVTGYNPGDIMIPLRLPPDLYMAQDKGVPLDLKYRYTPQPTSTNSSLSVHVDTNLVKSFALMPLQRLSGAPLLAKLQADETQPMQGIARIPTGMLQPKSQLELRYMYDYIKQGECRDVIVDNVRGAIDPESTLDISGYSHHLAMPNLAVYGNSGYPFTRLADLSQTAVVLPDLPQAGELSAYLNLLGRLGESTGYPGTALTVTRSSQVGEVADKDLLVVASGADASLVKRWAGALPVGLDDSRRPGLIDQLGKLLGSVAALLPDMIRPAAAATTPFSNAGLSAYAAGFESPLKSGRSVVLFWAQEPAALQGAVESLLGADGEPAKIAGSLAILRGKKVDTLAGEPTYHVGDLDWFTRTKLSMSGQFGQLALVAGLGAALLGGLVLRLLRSQFRKRSAP